MTVLESAIDPSVFIDNQRVDKRDLRNQFTIAQTEITNLQTNLGYNLSTTDLSTPQGCTTAIANAVAMFRALQLPGVINIPAGDWTMGVLPENEVDTKEGAAIILRTGVNGIIFRGAGSRVTTLRPETNKIEMFASIGGTNLVLEGMHLDNSLNGILENQSPPGTKEPTKGIAGLGNGANCGIRVGKPSDLTVRDVNFTGFCHCIDYMGDWESGEIQGETLRVDECIFKNFVFGVLTAQYRHAILTNLRGIDGIDRLDFGGNTAPGHVHYGANRSGIEPETLAISNVSAINCTSSPIKVRKGKKVTLANFVFEDVGRGFDLENVHSLTLTNANVKLAEVDPVDGFRSGCHLVGLANYEVNNIVVDRSGVDALGIQIEENAGQGSAPRDKNGRIRGVTVIDDLSGTRLDRPAIKADNVTDIEIEAPIYRTTGNVANTSWAVELAGCTRVHVNRPKRRSAAELRTITNITQTNPGVLTYEGPDPANGDQIYIRRVVGMTEVNRLWFTVANVNTIAKTFELSGVNTSGYGAYVEAPSTARATWVGEKTLGPSGSDRLVYVDADSLDCTVEWARDDIQVAPTLNTVVDDSADETTTIMRVDGMVRRGWTPVATFATAPTDMDPAEITHTTQTGWYRKRGDEILVGFTITFNTGVYAISAGEFRITGLGFTAAGEPGGAVNPRVGIGDHQKLNTTATDVGLRIAEGTDYFTLKGSLTGVAGNVFTTTEVPASTNAITLSGQISFRIVET